MKDFMWKSHWVRNRKEKENLYSIVNVKSIKEKIVKEQTAYLPRNKNQCDLRLLNSNIRYRKKIRYPWEDEQESLTEKKMCREGKPEEKNQSVIDQKPPLP